MFYGLYIVYIAHLFFIKQIMKLKGVKVVQLAAYMGVKPQSVTNKFSRDSWSVQDLISVMDFLDCQVVIEPKPDTKIILTLDDIK